MPVQKLNVTRFDHKKNEDIEVTIEVPIEESLMPPIMSIGNIEDDELAEIIDDLRLAMAERIALERARNALGNQLAKVEAELLTSIEREQSKQQDHKEYLLRTMGIGKNPKKPERD